MTAEMDRRWNVRETDSGTEVCRGGHERSEPCAWEPWPQKETIDGGGR